MTWIKWVACHLFIMLFIFKDLTITGVVLRQAIKSLSSAYPHRVLVFCLTDINTCTVTELYLSVWSTIGIQTLWVPRFCKFGLGLWPSSFSAHEQCNWKERKGQRDPCDSRRKNGGPELLLPHYACFIGIFQHSPLLLMLLFVVLPRKRNSIGVKWCQHFPLLICCAF